MLVKKELGEYASLEKRELLKSLETSEGGLAEEEARLRIKLFGPNAIAKQKELHVILEFARRFLSPLIIILLIASAISAYFGELTNAIIIALMIVLSVTLDFYEEHSANNAAKKLQDAVRTTATVLRNGKKIEINIHELCIGDIIFLSAGDIVPADSRIIEARDFFVNQASLTGESFPTEKTAELVKAKSPSLSGFTNIAFMGTSVVTGSAIAVVVKTGGETEFGKIASSLSAPSEKSEFEIGITNFGYLIMKVIFFLVLFIFLFNSITKHQILDSFLFGLAIAVGLTPELLPMIMSITLSKASTDMSKKGVIVKRLAAIPNFGGMDILCADKTGTLTEDRIVLVTYTDINGEHSSDVLLNAYLNSSYQTGIKNPLDEAVLNFRKVNINSYKKIDEIPFDFARKRMSVVVENNSDHYLITKGAPESVLNSCTHYHAKGGSRIFDDKTKDKAIEYYHKRSAEGYRVVGIAIKRITKNKKTYSNRDEADMKFLGFISFLDPPKKDVKDVLRELEGMGISIKIITGDNELVTKKICGEVGLEVRGVLLGSDAALLSDDALRAKVEKTNIFARFTPDEKNRVIRALRMNGHVVGYMGDGINDAPSLKTSDVGISVNHAVDVARESADIVLTHKSLHVLKEGVLDGRKAFGNTMKYIMMSLSSNFGNMFSAAIAVVFLPFLPMMPVQLLLNNFLYDVSQTPIPGDNVDSEFMQKPKRWNLGFIKKFMYIIGPVSSVFDLMTFFLFFFVFKASAAVFQTGWFLESLATQTLVIHIIRTKQVPFLQSRASKLLVFSTLACVVIGWIIPFTPIGEFFGFTPLPVSYMLAIAGIVIIYLMLVEAVKRWFYKRYNF